MTSKRRPQWGLPGRGSTRAGITTRTVAAVVVVLLASGTVFAADPSPSGLPSSAPSASSSASPTGSAPGSESPSVGPSKASPSDKSSEAPEASEAPQKPEAPEASDAPEAADKEGAPPTAAEIADFVGRLKAAGITTTPAAFSALVAKVGVGGAVRTLAFAQASGKMPAQIVAMFEGGKGWGKIDHELGLKIGPGIGWIMSGGHAHH